jgi:hypothetical protein
MVKEQKAAIFAVNPSSLPINGVEAIRTQLPSVLTNFSPQRVSSWTSNKLSTGLPNLMANGFNLVRFQLWLLPNLQGGRSI